MKTIEEMKTAIMPYVIGAVVGLGSVGILGLSIVENTASAVQTKTVVGERKPGMLNEDGDSQMMPELKAKDSHSQEKWLTDAMDVARQNESEDYEYSDCRGGGRIFEHEMLSEDYYEYFIPENLRILRDLYYKYEEKFL